MTQVNEFINIGFGNVVQLDRIVAVVNADSAPVRKMRDEARLNGRLIDASQGRKVRAVLVTDSNHVILSAKGLEALVLRLRGKEFIVEEL